MKKSLLISLSCACLAVLFVSCKSTDVTDPYPGIIFAESSIVMTNEGLVQGTYNYDRTTELFAGVPYAKPPVGDLRWKEPQNAERWEGVRDCTHFAPNAMQHQRSKAFVTVYNGVIGSKGDRTDFAPMSEDCLYLNIWRPVGTNAQKGDKLPVLVYIHGGCLRRGSSWYEDWDGEALSQKGIIVVTIAYRVGIFGYFAHEDLANESPNHTTGNYGLLDQIKALQWVNDNIGAFGGDASNITIAGESAGSSSVSALCASPLTKGLFRRAIGESSSLVVPVPPHTFRSKKDAYKISLEAMKNLGANTIEEMRKLPASAVVEETLSFTGMTVDDYAMPEYPWKIYEKGLNHEEALLNGFNANEGTAFAITTIPDKRHLKKSFADYPYITDPDKLYSLNKVVTDIDAALYYCDVFSAICFTYPHYSWTNMVVSQNRPVWEYYFTKTNKGIGDFHTGEIVYAYGNLKGHKNYNASDYKLEKIMTTYWSNFVKYGDPNGNPEAANYGKEVPYWQTSNESNGLLNELGKKIQMVKDPYMNIYQYLNYNIPIEDMDDDDLIEIDE